jgi:hypothetical protein
VQREPAVGAAVFALLDIQATLRSSGKITLADANTSGLLLNT